MKIRVLFKLNIFPKLKSHTKPRGNAPKSIHIPLGESPLNRSDLHTLDYL